jgi:AcrR family transcriptional regulator
MPKPAARKRPVAKSADRSLRKRRGIGRPPAGQHAVGRDALIARTCQMLTFMPPNRITRAEVARHMNVDPSLIRYYFRDRSTLLLAAAEKLTTDFIDILEEEQAQTDPSPAGRLRARVSTQLKLNVTYPFFHRLLIDELLTLDSPAARRFLDELTSRAVSSYGAILEAGLKEGVFRRSSGAFLFLAVIGMCEFFVNGMPILRIALGKDFDERAIGARYREFICELLLNGVKAR